MRILALVIDYRTSDEASRLTCQLARSRRDNFEVEIIHVDNGNPTPHALTAEQRELGIRLFHSDENDGYAGGILKAVDALDPRRDNFDAYWFLNSDLEVEADCLQKLVEVLRDHPRVGAVGPTVYFGLTKEKVWGARGVISPASGTTAMKPWPQGGVLPKWSYIPGCSILVRTTAYSEARGLPDRYRMYYEETHLCVQMQRIGWDLFLRADATAYHRVNSLADGIPAPHFAFYFARNNLYFWKTCFGIPVFLQLPRTLLVVIKELVIPLRRAQTLGEALDRLGYTAAGLIDGFSFLRARNTYFEKRLFLKRPS